MMKNPPNLTLEIRRVSDGLAKSLSGLLPQITIVRRLDLFIRLNLRSRLRIQRTDRQHYQFHQILACDCDSPFHNSTLLVVCPVYPIRLRFVFAASDFPALVSMSREKGKGSNKFKKELFFVLGKREKPNSKKPWLSINLASGVIGEGDTWQDTAETYPHHTKWGIESLLTSA